MMEMIQTRRSVKALPIHGVVKIKLKSLSDGRGSLTELFRVSHLSEGISSHFPASWQQCIFVTTRSRAIRGLHDEGFDRLVVSVRGRAYGAYVDIRHDSPTFGIVTSTQMAAGTALFLPKGVCNGFQAVGEHGVDHLYLFASEWRTADESIRMNPFDKELGINWPISIDPGDRNLVSATDANAVSFRHLTSRL
jgi:dTDP-4-dehydrorhamnose 3,5-epimerase